MGKHLKTQVIEGLKSAGFVFEALPKGSTPHKRGVHYCRIFAGAKCVVGAMDEEKEGRKYKKRIVVRPARYRDGLFELYTYHFPKHWSAACVENRELIKEAQRRAHALEKDCTPEGLEWRIRFLMHYFRVFKGGGKPEEGMKAYSRFYQYTYVAIYRQLKAAQKEAEIFQNSEVSLLHPLSSASLRSPVPSGDITFEPIDFRPRLQAFSSPLRRAYNSYREAGISGRSGPLGYSGGKARDTIPHNEQNPPEQLVPA
ncbi:MAG: hypothetical protein IJR42_06200 [Paludibacteraceae bacterium]|nr:hypothetical protein [Paludibacteraceae bacterium]